MKQKLQRLKGGRLGSQLFLKTFMLLAFMLSSVGSAWAQTQISKKQLFSSTAPDPAMDGNNIGDDAYNLGSNGNVSYYAKGLKDGDRKFVTITVGGKVFYKMQSDDIEKAHIKLEFNPGVIQTGDVITVSCAAIYNTNIAVGYKVGGSNTEVQGTFGTAAIELSHTLTANEIITDGDKQYVRIYRRDKETGFNTITVTRNSHVNPTAALDCETEITTTVGQAVTLTAHYTGTEVGATNTGVIWRHAKKNADGTMALIPGEEDSWAEYGNSFQFTPSSAGDYYFGVRGRQNCTNGGNYENGAAESAIYVHVHVDGPFNYSVIAKHDGNTLKTIASGSSETNVTVAYPRYILDGTTLYGIPYNASGDWWGTTVTSAAPTKELNYSETVSNVVFYTEGEDISGFSSFDNAARASNGRGARTANADTYKNATTLNAGKYKIVARGVNGNAAARTCNFKVGSGVVYTFSIPNGNDINGTSDEFTVSADGTQVSVACEGSQASGLDYFYIVKTGDYTPEIVYELNGGQCDRMTDPLNQEVTLPRPTKAGHTFIGWMNAAGDITPTAGKAGETKTYDAATTLYALWYKNNCEIDFTESGPLAGTPNKAGASISETGLFIAGGTPVGNITINEHQIDSRFGVQTGTSWIYNNNGLYQFNTGNRAIGLKECVEGEYITIVSSADPNVNAADAEKVSQDGNAYTYRVLKDTNVKFTPARNTTIYSITIASPCPHTIWTNGNVADADHKAGWWTNFSELYKITKGNTLNFKFKLHGGNAPRQYWTLLAQAIQKHNGDLGVTNASEERLMVRADGYIWGTNSDDGNNFIFKRNGTELPHNSGYNGGLKENDNQTTDATFIADIADADVDMSVTFGADGKLKVVFDMTSNVGEKNTYHLEKTSTPISEDVLYLAFVAEESWIEGITHPIKFAETTPHTAITSAGTATYTQPALGAPEGTWVKYEVVEGADKTTVESASISQIDGSSEYTLNIKGKGKVTVRATCGGNTAEYVLTVDGLMFTNPSPYEKHGTTSYDMVLDEAVDGVKFELVKYDTTPCLRGVTVAKDDDNKTCHIKNIPNGADDGGIIVVRATQNNSDGTKTIADCCLTIAYDLHVWDMYSDPLVYGSLVEGNDKTRDILTDDFGGTTGALDNGMNPQSRVGSAHYVIYDSSKSYTYVKPGDEDDPDAVDQAMTNNNRVEYNNWMDGQDYYRKENWFNAQNGVKECNAEGGQKDYDLLHRHWRFTYKTCTYDNGVRTYVNEPLFAYKNTVIGDNGRIIKQTAGLRFNAPSLKFGVSDNDTRDSEGGSRAVREQDRCVLLQVGSRLCIPRVKEGRYIRIHWYRHSDNNGDRVRITNGEDLDGREIDPRDVIRFTGSHYYEDHKGSFVFKVKKSSVADGLGITNAKNVDGDCCDVFIDPTGIGWTEFYRIEIMDKFESELKICEVDVDNEIKASDIKNAIKESNIGDKYATIDSYNSNDLNSHDAYNRQKFFTPDADDTHSHEVYANRLVSKIRTRAIAKEEGIQDHNDPLEKAHNLWLSGYPGHCYTWNGWLNTTVQAEFTGSAMCEKDTKTDSWKRGEETISWEQPNTIPSQRIWVGNRLQYTMHNLEKAWGEGTIKLTFRTHSGWEGEPHYTFDKQQVYVAVGQYSVQKYPYTWDFTNYNFGLPNDYNLGTTYGGMESGVNAYKEYGYWETKKEADAVSSFDMWSCHGSITDKIGGGNDGTYHELRDQNRKLNKREFAQGSQLSMGTISQAHTILETEGLRFYIPAIKSGNDNHDVQLYPNAASNIQDIINGEDMNKGCLKVKAGCKITIPEVDKDMYVFISGTVAPSATTNTKDSDTQFAPNVSKKNKDAVITYYQATGAADGGKADIELSFNQDAILYKIGVTNEKKTIAYFGYSTESRARNIDYNETRYFSADVEQSYVNVTDGWNDKSGNFDYDKDLEVRVTAQTFPAKDRAYTPHGTGIIMHDLDVQYNAEDEDKNASNKPIVPLFVAACNVPQTDDNLSDNKLVASTDIGKDYTEIWTSKDGDDEQYYTMSNHYIGAKLENNFWKTGKIYTNVPRFYRYIGSGASSSDAAFVKTSANMYNMAYLYFSSAAGVKGLGDIISVDFGDGIGAEPTGIEIVGYGVNPTGNGIYYNLRGQALNGKPSVPGVYIKDGKKYYVK